MATKKSNFWKWVILIAGLIVASYFIGSCNGRKSVLKSAVVTHDSLIIRTIPIPYKVEQDDSIVYMTHTEHDSLFWPLMIEVPGKIDTIFLPTTPQWVVDKLNDCNSSRSYDSSYINNRDTVRIIEVVKNNRITGRTIKFYTSDSTIILKPQKRWVGSLYLGGLGAVNYMGIKAGFGLENKDNVGFIAEITYVNGIKKPFYGGTLKLPIRLNK